MRYDDDARLDTSEVTDQRGQGGGSGGVGGGGGGGLGGLLPLLLGLLLRGRSGKVSGIVVLVVVVGLLAVQFLGGGTSAPVAGGFGEPGGPTRAGTSELASECRTGADADPEQVGAQGGPLSTPRRSSRPAARPANGRPAFITDISPADLATAVDAAQRIGDDYIQGQLGGGTVDPDSFTHGTSAQRKRWLSTGFSSGDPTRCDTFRTNDLG
jgi:predicted metalloprotease